MNDEDSKKAHDARIHFVDELIERSKRRRAITDGVIKQVAGWGIIAFLGGVGIAVADFVAQLFHWNHN